MFRERKNSFLLSMKFIWDLIIFSDFTGLVFLLCSPADFFHKKTVCSFRSSHAGSYNTTAEKVLKDLEEIWWQYSFGEIEGFVCLCLLLTYMPQLTFGTVWFTWCVIAVWQAVYHTSKSVHHSTVKYTLAWSINTVCEGQR